MTTIWDNENNPGWAEGVAALTKNASGFIEVDFVDPISAARLFLSNKPANLRLFNAAMGYLNGLDGQKAICLTCETVIDTTQGIGIVVVASSPTSATALCMGLCDACTALGQAEATRRSIEALRNVWPDLRVFADGVH